MSTLHVPASAGVETTQTLGSDERMLICVND